MEEGLTFMGAMQLVAALDRVGREPGDELRDAIGVVAAAGLAAPDPDGIGGDWRPRARKALTDLRDGARARDREAVGAAWGKVRVLMRELARRG